MRELAQFQGNEMSVGLFQNFIDTYIYIFLDSPTPLLVKVWVLSRGSPIQRVPNQEDPSLNTMDSKFYEICVQNQLEMKFLDLSGRLQHS